MRWLLEQLNQILAQAEKTGLNDAQSKQLERISKDLENRDEKAVDASKTLGFDSGFISAISARIGTVILIIFLVQILVTLYRYSLRLAAFYDARADALELGETPTSARIKVLSEVFTPLSVDFGDAPRSALEAALETAKGIAVQRAAGGKEKREED